MAHYPDFSDSEDNCDSDDCDYYDFKERVKNIYKRPGSVIPKVETEEEKRDQQLKSLFNALSGGHVNNVIKLLENGLDVNVDVQDGWRPILLAASFGDQELCKELIIRGADVNSDRDGRSALMMASSCPKNTTPHEKSLAVIKQLVDSGADVKAINRKRMTALMFAASAGNLPAVKYLLPLSNSTAEDNQRWTALFWAVNSNEVEVVKYLLDEGFTYNSTDVRSNTLLDIAKRNDFDKIIELFPDEELNVITNIMDTHTYTFDDIFSNLEKGKKPKFLLDICNMLCGIKSESVIKLIPDIDLCKFLSISDEELKTLGVRLPYQRQRILGGLYRFHKYPFHPQSLHVVPLNERYSNSDMALQLLATIKQVIAMEASLIYVMKNFGEEIAKSDISQIKMNVLSIHKKVRLCKAVTKNIKQKAKMLDNHIKPVDLITAKSRKYMRWPWRKLAFSFSVFSLIVVFRIWK